MDRRSFLKGAASAGAAAAIPFTALIARAQEPSHRDGLRRGHTAGYGPLFSTLDQTTGLPLVALPEGFKYLSFGWTGDPLANGPLTPGAHDGMAAFPAGKGLTRLVRNHERGAGTPFAPASAIYDPAAGGGTTTMLFDTHKGELVSAEGSISGTVRNCAGGLMPWGTWLTSEETMDTLGQPHGYVFEVPTDGLGDPTPLRDNLATIKVSANLGPTQYLTVRYGRDSNSFPFNASPTTTTVGSSSAARSCCGRVIAQPRDS